MKYQALLEAIVETERFLDRARELENSETLKRNKNPKIGPYIIYEGKLTAATKRASMDLTRALAELRKP